MRLTTGYGPGKPEIWHAADVPLEERLRQHGRGSFDPPTGLVAGEPTTIDFEFELGEQEIPPGGELGIAWRWPLDWAGLRTEDPGEPGYVTVRFEPAEGRVDSQSVVLVPRYEAYGGIEPYHHYLALTVQGEPLRCGDRVSITCGERNHGGPGWRAPTCAVREAEFLMLVSTEGGQRWTELPRCDPFPILPGIAERLVVVAPSDVVVGEAADVLIRAEDRWGNATALATPARITTDGDADGLVVNDGTTTMDPPSHQFNITFTKPGLLRVRAALPDGSMATVSNPTRVHATAPMQRVFWGDLHSGQTLIGCGAGTLAEHYAYGRDAAGLQFITHQANDHYVTVADWEETRRETERFHEPGRYITILGCEWSPVTAMGGDRNVFYNYDEPRMRRSDRFFTEAEPDPEPDVPTAEEFHAAFGGLDVLVNLHVGGRPTNLQWHEPRIEKLAEVHSTHGTSQWFVEDCLRRGYRIGITAGTCGVMGRPGACHPGSRLIRNVRGGLTAVVAEELTRESLWQALHARRCYATTGPRMLLSVEVDGHPMGSAFATDKPPRIVIECEGTAPIERVELMRGVETICTWNMAPVYGPSEGKLRLLWGGTQERGTARRQRVTWDGSLEVENGRITDAGPVGFQSPLDAIQHASPHRVAWQSATAGNDMGLTLAVEAEAATRFRFRSEPCSFDFTFNQVSRGPLTVDAGGVGRYVSIGPAPKPTGPTRVELSYRDAQRVSDVCPYWVRLVQVDQEKAWSSPVYVERRP